MVVNYIIAKDFGWIFESFSKSGEISGVNTKLLRKLLNNTYEIIREEAPQKEISVGTLETVANKDELLDIVGIAPLGSGASSVGTNGSPNSAAEAGVPVEQIISNNSTNDLNNILQVAVNTWQDYDVLVEKRDAIYEFYNERTNLDLSDESAEFLFRSSISNIIQGSEWMIRYNGEIDSLLSGVTEILDGQTVAAYERNLLALGDEGKLREISETELSTSAWSSAEEYADYCDMESTDRIKQYTNDVVRFDGDNYPVNDLVSGSENLSDLFSEVVEALVEEDDSDTRRALREIELIRIVNSPLCAT